jgi:hypothetical protein
LKVCFFDVQSVKQTTAFFVELPAMLPLTAADIQDALAIFYSQQIIVYGKHPTSLKKISGTKSEITNQFGMTETRFIWKDEFTLKVELKSEEGVDKEKLAQKLNQLDFAFRLELESYNIDKLSLQYLLTTR